MTTRAACVISALLGCLAASLPLAAAESTASLAENEAGASAQSGKVPYLSGADIPDMSAILPPPPALGTPGAMADDATFQATRALKDSPRWTLATRDADDRPEVILGDFSCALGVNLVAGGSPTLDTLLHRVLKDVEEAFRTAKGDVKRLRPLVGNDLPICVPRTERLEHTFSYPSGHATRGWTFALILAELAPDKATPILERGRVYGESRVVCGAHWLSDVEAGRTVGAALVAALHGDAMFRADLDRARGELIAARHAGAVPDAAECRVESDAASVSPR